MSPVPRASVCSLRWAWPLVLLLFCGSARADELYFMAVFGSQRDPNDPKYSHSFAVFIKATGDGPCPAGWRVEYFTISWLPTSLDVRLWSVCPEPGANFELHFTLRVVRSLGERVSMWGPYQIDRRLYERAVRQAGRLGSGVVKYKAVDTGYPTARVSNCIHAISDLAEEQRRLRVFSPGWGEIASSRITRRLEPWIICPGQTHDWLIDCLGLCNYPIVRRSLDDRPSGLLRLCFAPR